jgi:hypothetical protein
LKFGLKSVLWGLTAFALLAGPLLVTVPGFGESWLPVLLGRMADYLWQAPLIVVFAASWFLIWRRRHTNLRIARLALYGIGLQLLVWYLNFIYNLWLEKVSRRDQAVFTNPEEVLSPWHTVYGCVEILGLTFSWGFIICAILAALTRPVMNPEP